ncbi:hypothetical protein AAVH_27257 [Aphelenchoides avenae]|nr:hypothetical protein AAVH_27257 [Aphelenchus avenae]
MTGRAANSEPTTGIATADFGGRALPRSNHPPAVSKEESTSRAATGDNASSDDGGIGSGSCAVPKTTQPQQDSANDVVHPVSEVSIELKSPSVQPTEQAPLEVEAALAEVPPAEVRLLRVPKQELDEDIDVEVLDEPPVSVRDYRSSCASSSTNTPSLPTLAGSSSLSRLSVPVAYFGDAVYDRVADPSSFTYESDVYGGFNFVLLDEVQKGEGGQLNVVRLYQCEACLALSQTHEYKDEVVHTIMTSGQRIVKYDPAAPRGILHLRVRHRHSILKKLAS